MATSKKTEPEMPEGMNPDVWEAMSPESREVAIRMESGEVRDELARDLRDLNVVKAPDGFGIGSFEEALALFRDSDIPVDDSADVIGDGYVKVEKDELVNKRFLLQTWTFSYSQEYGGVFVVARGITDESTPLKFRVTDGSTGFAAELMSLTKRRVESGHTSPNAGLLCNRGLSKSTYKTTVNGQEITAATFHIA